MVAAKMPAITKPAKMGGRELVAKVIKIFSAADSILVQFRYLEEKQWQTADFTVCGVENEAQLEREILKSPVFRFNKTIQFHICKVRIAKHEVEEFNVIYNIRKNKTSHWQRLQQKMISVPTKKIARNALFWREIEKYPECEISVVRLERPAPAPVSFRYSNVLHTKKEYHKFIDLSEELLKPFSTDALENSRNNQHLAEFNNFWSTQYTAIPNYIQQEIQTKIPIWQKDNFKKIPQTDALLAEFIKKEIQLIRAANNYCQLYERAHTSDDSERSFAKLVLLMEERRTALWQLESHLKKTAGVPAYRYK